MRKSLLVTIGASGIFVAAAVLIPTASASPGNSTAHNGSHHTITKNAKGPREGSVSAADLL